MLDVIRERAGVKAERWLTNVASIGNAGTASIPIALAGSYGARALPSSLALVSAGAGLSWLGLLMSSIATPDVELDVEAPSARVIVTAASAS